MAHYKSHIFIIGGEIDSKISGSVDYVEISNKQPCVWGSAPDLTMPRRDHSSCVIGSHIYTFGGMYLDKSYIAGIERLDAKSLLEGADEKGK